MVDWTKCAVKCAECDADLWRRLYRPNDGMRILNFFCGFKCKAEWQKKQHPVSNEWLRQKYEVEKMNCTQIANIVGRDPKSVWTWLQHAGIETRPRGMGVPSRLFRKGQPSSFRGKIHSAEARAKISRSNIGKPKRPKGDKHHWAGKTGPQHPSWKGGLTPERNAFYSSQEWRKACIAVWARADAKCERCGHDSRPKDLRFHVHHIVSFQVRELRAKVSNLALLCEPCHRWVHGRSNADKVFLRGPQ